MKTLAALVLLTTSSVVCAQDKPFLRAELKHKTHVHYLDEVEKFVCTFMFKLNKEIMAKAKAHFDEESLVVQVVAGFKPKEVTLAKLAEFRQFDLPVGEVKTVKLSELEYPIKCEEDFKQMILALSKK
jgi:hypothetical protein